MWGKQIQEATQEGKIAINICVQDAIVVSMQCEGPNLEHHVRKLLLMLSFTGLRGSKGGFMKQIGQEVGSMGNLCYVASIVIRNVPSFKNSKLSWDPMVSVFVRGVAVAVSPVSALLYLSMP